MGAQLAHLTPHLLAAAKSVYDQLCQAAGLFAGWRELVSWRESKRRSSELQPVFVIVIALPAPAVPPAIPDRAQAGPRPRPRRRRPSC